MKNTKEYILLEAFKLFLEKGYDKVSMSELVSVSGLSKGAFYHYFSSKEELFRESITAHFFSALGEKLPSPKQGNSLVDSLISIIDYKALAYKNMLELNENSNFFNLLFQAISMFPEFRNYLKVGSLAEETMMAQLFDDAMSRGEINSTLPPKQLAQMYAAMLDGMELHAVVIGELDSLHNEERRITLEFVKLLKNNN